MEFPKFFESAAANVPPNYAGDGHDDDRLAPDGVQPFPAPRFINPPGPAPGATVTTIEIPDGPPQTGGPPTDVIEDRDWGESGFSAERVDAIAFYPWPADPQAWGIYFLERPFFAFVKEMAAVAGVPAGPLAPSFSARCSSMSSRTSALRSSAPSSKTSWGDRCT